MPRRRTGCARPLLVGFLGALVASGLVACGGAGQAGGVPVRVGSPPAKGQQQAPTEEAYSDEVFVLTNAERVLHGLPPLAWSDAAAQASTDHSAWQRWNGGIQHAGPNGTQAGDRLMDVGVIWDAWAENVAVGYATPADVLAGWMNSPGHRENILRSNVTHLGVGTREGSGGPFLGPWCTQTFFR